jgi:hypothetical protein
MESKTSTYPEYTEGQLKGALDSLLEGSSDQSFDGRHLFGFRDCDHKLSKLQSITATRILDYETYMVRQQVYEQDPYGQFQIVMLISFTYDRQVHPLHRKKNCSPRLKTFGRNMVPF